MVLLHFNGFCQSCLPEGIIFNTQSQIDSFQINYPGCTEIEGDVTIYSGYNGYGISNLNELNVLTYVGGDLYISNNDSLFNLTGLENLCRIEGELNVWSNELLLNLNGLNSLTYIGSDFEITHNNSLNDFIGIENLDTIIGTFIIEKNPDLTNFSGLENLRHVEGWFSVISNEELETFAGLNSLVHLESSLDICYNHSLQSLSGLNNLESIGGYLTIGSNKSLKDLRDLNNLSSIGWMFQLARCDSLTSLSGLDSLTYIGGPVKIWFNDALISLSGIDNVSTDSIGDLTIYGNPLLCECDIQSICNYLSNPPRAITIFDNGPGCNNPSEIAENCNIILQCLPFGNYYFRKQSEIDSFALNYPDCNCLEGNVNIRGYRDSIFNLNGLAGVDTIAESLEFGIVGLPNLSGLQNLKRIGGQINIGSCHNLKSLYGVENLTYVGGIYIRNNDSLNSLEGLDNLPISNGGVWIERNPSLTNLDNLDHLTSINGHLMILENSNLSSIMGLRNVSSINGYLYIEENPLLTDLKGIDLIDYESITNLYLISNPILSTCNVKSICDFLFYQGGFYLINNNTTGCNNAEEVILECTTSLPENNSDTPIFVYPNPVLNEMNISFTNDYIVLEINIYNCIGQRVRHIYKPSIRIDISWLNEGIYIIEIISEKEKYREKFIKK